MDQFAVFRIAKFKQIGGIGVHIDRHHISAKIYKAKTFFNEDLAYTLGMTVGGRKSHLQGNRKAPQGCVRDMGSLYVL